MNAKKLITTTAAALLAVIAANAQTQEFFVEEVWPEGKMPGKPAAEPEGGTAAGPQAESSDDSQVLDTAQVTQVQKNQSPVTIIVLIASAALLLLVAVLIAVLLTMKRR